METYPLIPVLLALIAFMSALIAGFFKLFAQLSKSLDNVAVSNKGIEEATRKSADEAEKRNGHLGTLITNSEKNTANLVDRNLEAYKEMHGTQIKADTVEIKR